MQWELERDGQSGTHKGRRGAELMERMRAGRQGGEDQPKAAKILISIFPSVNVPSHSVPSAGLTRRCPAASNHNNPDTRPVGLPLGGQIKGLETGNTSLPSSRRIFSHYLL